MDIGDFHCRFSATTKSPKYTDLMVYKFSILSVLGMDELEYIASYFNIHFYKNNKYNMFWSDNKNCKYS